MSPDIFVIRTVQKHTLSVTFSIYFPKSQMLGSDLEQQLLIFTNVSFFEMKTANGESNERIPFEGR